MALTFQRQARIMAMQALFEWDISHHDPMVTLRLLAQERAAPEDSVTLAETFIAGTVANSSEIDEILERAALNRSIDLIAGVDKAILRLAIFEIMFYGSTPYRVAINEAVELAKTYGGDNSKRFVNGALSAVYTMYASKTAQHSILESEKLSMAVNSPHWETLKTIVADKLNVEESDVTPEASFTDDLNADSLDVVELVMELEEKFDVKIRDDDARKIKTVGDALEYIDEHAQ